MPSFSGGRANWVCQVKSAAKSYRTYYGFSSIEVLDREALGVSNIINNLVTHYQLMSSNTARLTPELLQSFLEQVTRLTVFFAEGAANEESVSHCEFLCRTYF